MYFNAPDIINLIFSFLPGVMRNESADSDNRRENHQYSAARRDEAERDAPHLRRGTAAAEEPAPEGRLDRDVRDRLSRQTQ